ncbi:Aminoglycoside 6-adenylyltransferase [Sporomusa ovata DSM 2662]|uniref:Aminoglycoside 6-adenylyltransferase n=1 Tax=Sporomusa ovata TaxID=2378 RepID=A0A0U1L0J2_9FIRM|nr:aminoglycoside 6-adenylyltransferase [Sporomusa ovata]EQB27346.1 aminoglycoside 6-adenylyltransferase [Sporomusa ovata DSM 2662]CQR73187.1 Aminoglycoside 6-adenylyltransferase [Sporomusa ovata]
MRSEKEMMDLIIAVANNDVRIRAAYLEGSRANPNVPKDIFQDYDIVYVVTETRSFREDKAWIDRFGDRLYMQYPEENIYYTSDVENCYGWLIQFTDGNRLDLHVKTLENVLNSLELYKTLVDKDNIMPQKQVLSDEEYWVKKPVPNQFYCTCNEFWWCLNNVAKGLWRNEIPYAMDMINFQIRPMLRRLLEWKIGIDNDFSVSAGKSAKYMDKYLPKGIYEQYLESYSKAQINAIWDAVFLMCDLFQKISLEVSEKLNFPYDLTEARNSKSYLERVKSLPSNATEIY